jgi:hypothetical protein
MKTIKLSELRELEIGEELEIEVDDYVYGFTKQEMLDCEFLIFGAYGGGCIETTHILNDGTKNYERDAYEEFEKRINKVFTINIKIELDK